MNDPEHYAEWRSKFTVMDRLVMEQNAASIIIEPVVTDDNGGFLVAEPKEAQIRSHNSRGELVRTFGRSGQGPGELLAPIRARRLRDGTIAVADLMQPRMTFYDSVGSVDSRLAPVYPIFDFVPMENSGEILAGGFADGAGDKLLHVFSVDSASVLRSFMDVPDNPVVRRLVTSLGFPSFAVQGDEIAAVMALSDTLYFFDISGRDRGRVQLPIPGWVMPTDPPNKTASPQERQEWIEKLVQPVAVFWAGDAIAVAYGRQKHRDLTWGVLLVERDGTVLENIIPSPRLLMTLGDTFVFDDPDVQTPGTWLLARRKP